MLLRSDGQVIAVGDDSYGQTDILALPDGVTYTAVHAGAVYTELVRSDGQVIFIGGVALPALPQATYTAVAAGGFTSACSVP